MLILDEVGEFLLAKEHLYLVEGFGLSALELCGLYGPMLAGKFVPEKPVRIRHVNIQRPYLLSRTTIAPDVECRLPPEEVLEQYRHAQHEILGGTPRALKNGGLVRGRKPTQRN